MLELSTGMVLVIFLGGVATGVLLMNTAVLAWSLWDRRQRESDDVWDDLSEE